MKETIKTRSSRNNGKMNQTVTTSSKKSVKTKNSKKSVKNKNNKIIKKVPKKNVKNNNKPLKRRKIKYGKILLTLIVLSLFVYLLWSIIGTGITNIYISGNKYLTDQQVIELAKLENYPSTFANLSFKIENRLEKNIYVYNAIVSKKWFLKVYIKIEENIPLFYNKPKGKTILLNKVEVNDKFSIPELINIIPSTKYNEFITKMSLLESDILNKISEIEYSPKEGDDTRFLLKMVDGNYVYINFNKFENLNNYIDIIKYIGDKKGILNLDAGNSFEILKK